jgi:hypothetical protein
VKWVTRERPKTDRIACPWLIKNFIDPEAEFLFVPAREVLDVARSEDARSYDATGAHYTHRDERLLRSVATRVERPRRHAAAASSGRRRKRAP